MDGLQKYQTVSFEVNKYLLKSIIDDKKQIGQIKISKNDEIKRKCKSLFYLDKKGEELYRRAIRENKRVIFWVDYDFDGLLTLILDLFNINKYDYILICKGCSNIGTIINKEIKELNLLDEKVHILHFGSVKFFPSKYKVEYVKQEANYCFMYRSPYSKTKNGRLCNEVIKKVYCNINIGDEIESKIGLEVLGPILLGYLQYLTDVCKKEKYDKIYFLSREGKLLQEAYKILFGDRCIENYYLKVSRKSLIIPQLSDINTFSEFEILIRSFLRAPSLKSVLELCGIDYSTVEANVKYWGISLEDDIKDIKDKQAIFNLIKEKGQNSFTKQKELLSQYLNENEFEGKIAICDVGWYGTMQAMLSNMADEKSQIEGVYIGVRTPEDGDIYNNKKHGYLFSKYKNEKYDYMLRFSNEIFELMTLNNDGSVFRYDINNGRVEPILCKSEYSSKEVEFVKRVQNYALLFLREIRNVLWLFDENLLPEDAIEGYIKFAVYPSSKNVNLLCNFSTFDERKKTIVPLHGLRHYFLHPHEFVADIANHCKIFTLKKIFKLPFPYFDILYLLVGRVGIKSEYKRRYYSNKSQITNGNTCQINELS